MRARLPSRFGIRAISEHIRIGTVIETDLSGAVARVAVGGIGAEPGGDLETDWLPWLAPRAGATRVWSPPSAGEQVVLLCPDGDLGAALILPGLWSDDHPPPGADGRELIIFEDGAIIAYDPEAHRLEVILPAGGSASITADGGTTIHGPVTINGDLTLNGNQTCSRKITAATDVVGGGVSLKLHTHGGVAAGGSTTAPPG